MSWPEVKKINSNMMLPLNDTLKQCIMLPTFIISSGTFVWSPPKSGKYRVICVGRGADGNLFGGGGAGGVVLKDWDLLSTTNYPYSIETTAPDRTIFNSTQIAYAGMQASSSQHGQGGSGSGGIVYPGNYGNKANRRNGGSVGIYMEQLVPGGLGSKGMYEFMSTALVGGNGGSGIFGRLKPPAKTSTLAANGGDGADFGGGGGGGEQGKSTNSQLQDPTYGKGGAGGIIIQFLEGVI